MTRRELLGRAAAAPLFVSSIAPSLWAKKNHIGRDRFSAITDEISKSPADAIAFAHTYGLKWLELRDVPGKKSGSYTFMAEDGIRAAAKEFHDAGIKISFLNTGMLKFGLPGTEPARLRPETPEAKVKREEREHAQFDRRMADLDKAIKSAHILGVNKMRVFSFTRVAEPEKLSARIAEILDPMIRVCEKEGVQLLLENEGSCNVATSAELAAAMKFNSSKAFGLNWDPHNTFSFKEVSFPDGYALLPKKRIGNVQTKGKSLLWPDQKFDWAGIFHALERDGYQGQVGLETHIFDDKAIEHSHNSMKEMLRIAGDM